MHGVVRHYCACCNTSMASEAYGGGAAAAPEGSAPAKDSRNSLYSFDEQKLELLRKTKPWTQDPKYFKKVKISPSAAMKMVSWYKHLVCVCGDIDISSGRSDIWLPATWRGQWQ